MGVGFPHRSGPGFDAKRETTEAQVFFGYMFNEFNLNTRAVDFDSTATDTGNTGLTSTLRAGNVVALDDANSNAYVYDADATDGRQCAIGVLTEAMSMLDADGTAEQKNNVNVLTLGGVRDGDLVGDHDAASRAQLIRRGIHFDTGLGAAFLMHPMCEEPKSANYTVVAADNGKELLATGAVNFTLPTIANGLCFLFTQTADANMIVTGSDNIVHKNNAAADTVTFSTSNEKIGSSLLVRAAYVDGTLLWLAYNLGGTTAVAAG